MLTPLPLCCVTFFRRMSKPLRYMACDSHPPCINSAIHYSWYLDIYSVNIASEGINKRAPPPLGPDGMGAGGGLVVPGGISSQGGRPALIADIDLVRASNAQQTRLCPIREEVCNASRCGPANAAENGIPSLGSILSYPQLLVSSPIPSYRMPRCDALAIASRSPAARGMMLL